MHAVRPEIWVFEIFLRLVTKPISDVFADEGRLKASRRLIAVDHGWRALEQSRQTRIRLGFLFFRCLTRRDVTPRSNDLQWFTVDAPNQTLLVVHPAIRAILAAKAILHRVDPILEEFGDGLLDAGPVVG